MSAIAHNHGAFEPSPGVPMPYDGGTTKDGPERGVCTSGRGLSRLDWSRPLNIILPPYAHAQLMARPGCDA